VLDDEEHVEPLAEDMLLSESEDSEVDATLLSEVTEARLLSLLDLRRCSRRFGLDLSWLEAPRDDGLPLCGLRCCFEGSGW